MRDALGDPRTSSTTEIDELEDGAVIYGGGESVTGLPCIIIAVVLMATPPR
jgi:hypothetical protein